MKRIGIYKIINLENNKVYVGSSANLPKRKFQHFNKLKRNIHSNAHLQHAFNKSGIKNFRWQIIEYLFQMKNLKKLQVLLLKREQYYLEKYKAYDMTYGYNICKFSNNVMLGRQHSIKTKKLLSNFNKGNTYAKGSKRSEKIKQKMSKSHKGKKRSKKSKYNQSKAQMKQVINLTTNEIFNSIKEAAKKHNIKSSGNIVRVCKNKLKTAKGFKWEYIKKETT